MKWAGHYVAALLSLGVAAIPFGLPAALAGEADVIGARAEQTAPGVWTFHVTVAHADTGWEHYAERFEIVAPDGTVLGTRVLLHPHVSEQPFTRSLGGVKIDPQINEVIVRAYDSVHGLGGLELAIELRSD